MAFAFSREDRSPADGVRRIAAEEIAAALHLIDSHDPASAAPVHGLRKHVKKLRGLIRLVRPNFREYAVENAALRDAARGISGLRDAEVLLATAEALRGKASGRTEAALATVCRDLSRSLAAARAHQQGGSLSDFRAAIAGVGDRVPGWTIGGRGFATLEEGLATTWNKAQKLQRAAHRDASVEAIHEWRKRVKDHWYQSRLLTPIWPETMTAHARAADDLGEMLGLHHDLAVLIDHVEASDLATKDRKAIVSMAQKRQKKLEKRSHELADRLFAGSDRDLVDRWGTWWQVWRTHPDHSAGVDD